MGVQEISFKEKIADHAEGRIHTEKPIAGFVAGRGVWMCLQNKKSTENRTQVL